MSKSKAFKIITHLSHALVLEEEIFEEEDEVYKTGFIQDFQIEQAFLCEMKMTKKDLESSEKKKSSAANKEVLKKIHRKLAMKTHPDSSGGDDSEFKNIQKAYEENDGATLLIAAQRHDIDVEIEESDIKQMMDNIHLRRNELEDRKNTLRWVWGVSNKDENTRKIIRSAMQIDEAIFQEWLKKKEAANPSSS